MLSKFIPKLKFKSQTFDKFITPLLKLLPFTPQLLSRGDRPLKMTFEDQLKALVYFHLQEHKSARHLIQDMKENDFVKQNIAPDEGISRSRFSEAVNHRGLVQLQFIFENLYNQVAKVLPKKYKELGDLMSIDGSLIDAVLSMYWTDYRKGSKKAKAHCGFNINSGIPSKVFLTEGKGGERPFVDQVLAEGQTGVLDRGYQSHRDFDLLQERNKHFVCRIKAKTTRTIIEKYSTETGSYIFYDVLVSLGSSAQNKTKTPVRVVGYEIAGSKYYIATDRHDLTAEQIATIYKLRWTITTSKGKIYYYRCLGSDDYRYPNGRVCQTQPIRQDYLDGVIWKQIIDLLKNPKLIQFEIKRRIQTIQTSNPTKQRKDVLNKKIKKTEKSIEKLLDAYQEDLLQLDELRSRMPD